MNDLRVPSPKKRVAAYARVASQPLDDLWLEQQVEPLKRFVESHEACEWHRVYADAGIPASQPRPQLEALLQDCDAGNIDIVITASASRLARDTGKLMLIAERLRRSNTMLILQKEGVNRGDIACGLLWAVAWARGGIIA